MGFVAAASVASFAACSSDVPVAPTDAGLPAPVDASTRQDGAVKVSLCVDGKPAEYPTVTKIDLFGTIPPLTFPQRGGGKYSLLERFEPCAPRSKVLLLRETAAFCGPCGWAQKHTADIVPKELADVVDRCMGY